MSEALRLAFVGGIVLPADHSEGMKFKLRIHWPPSEYQPQEVSLYSHLVKA